MIFKIKKKTKQPHIILSIMILTKKNLDIKYICALKMKPKTKYLSMKLFIEE